ncbi:hypothetical protein [Halalkalirubrum salinum]|uniref:hypothetical protein n=1 Tax=Halalkalirubrum salinum TaxID=2563889 RepID=UPI0010FBA5B0|nr:hypothetical protein [Halalkalirubrum salinum]
MLHAVYRWLFGVENRSLEEVREIETIADVVDLGWYSMRLPGDWDVRVDIVQYGQEALTQVLICTHPTVPIEFVLVPAQNAEPTADIAVYRRDRTRGTRTQLERSVVNLETAIDTIAPRLRRIERRQAPFVEQQREPIVISP